jgi:hypothetical protein
VKPPSVPRPANHRALPSPRLRDAAIASAAGAAVLAFILFAIFYFSRQADSTGGLTGTIIAKSFVPRPETQITFGQGGLSSRAIAGEYIFRVRVPAEGGRIYRVSVSAATYGNHEVGETFYFLRPPVATPAH